MENQNQDVIKYATGRNSERFTNLDEAKQYADKWKDKSISVYKNALYHSTIHKKNGNWND
jgi:hypothetical protein